MSVERDVMEYDVLVVGGAPLNTPVKRDAVWFFTSPSAGIKDPAQNITWVAPEGSGEPNYANM